MAQRLRKRARRRAARRRLGSRWSRRPAESLPFEDGSFDSVVSTLVLCSVEDPSRAAREVARVLRPDGRLLYLEHVRSPDGGGSRAGRIASSGPGAGSRAGCHPNRIHRADARRRRVRGREAHREKFPKATDAVGEARDPRDRPPGRPGLRRGVRHATGSRPPAMKKLTPVELAPWTLPLIVVAIDRPDRRRRRCSAGRAPGSSPGRPWPRRSSCSRPAPASTSRSRSPRPPATATACSSSRPSRPTSRAAVEAIAGAVRSHGGTREPTRGCGRRARARAGAQPAVSHWLSDLGAAREARGAGAPRGVARGARRRRTSRRTAGSATPTRCRRSRTRLRRTRPSEVIFVSGEGEAEVEVGELRRRLDRPLSHVVAGSRDQPLERTGG